MKNSDALRRLIAELVQDFDFIVLNALGYTLHNLYNAFEGYFLRIAKFFENSLDDLTWHRALLERMTLSIEGIRPALLVHDLDGDAEPCA